MRDQTRRRWERPGSRSGTADRSSREGEVVAVLSVGSYNQSMHIDHCLRPPAAVLAFADRGSSPVH